MAPMARASEVVVRTLGDKAFATTARESEVPEMAQRPQPGRGAKEAEWQVAPTHARFALGATGSVSRLAEAREPPLAQSPSPRHLSHI